MNIKVGNIKEYGLEGTLAGRKHVYIGRSGKGHNSPLGNPFSIGRDGTRDEVVAKYRTWLWKQIQEDNRKVIFELRLILSYTKKNEVVLVCFCAPEACHGDVLIKCLEWMSTQEQYKV